MDPSKDYYEQRLAAHAHQAWAAAAAYHNPAAQHYMQRIQQFFPPSHSSTPPQQPTATAPNPYPQSGRNEHLSSSGSQTVKEQVYSANPQLNSSASVSGGNSYPPGHPMHFPGVDYRHSHRASPSPAHSGNGNAPLPAHRSSPSLSKARDASETSIGMQPASTTNPQNAPSPLPAHMRSNPYQPTTNYHNLNSPYHPTSQLMHHPSYLPPSGLPPSSTNSSHYPPLSSNPPHIPQAMGSNNSNSAMSHPTNGSDFSKYPPHRAEYSEQGKLPLNDPRSLVPNGGMLPGEASLPTSHHYQSNQRHPRDGDHLQHNYNNNYNNSSSAPEDFSNSGRNDSRRKDSFNSLDGNSAYNKQHRVGTPTTSTSSHNSFPPFSSHYSNLSSSAPPINSVGQQPQPDANYGNAYTGMSSYGSQIYNDRLDPSAQQNSANQHHHSNQTIVQPRGPTIDASIKYSASEASGADTSLRNQSKGSYSSTIAHHHDQRRHHHSSGNSSGNSANDDHQRIPSYPNHHPSHQPYAMQNSHSTPSMSNSHRLEAGTNNSSNRIMPPVTGHPYMPQNVPLPPPDVSKPPQHHQSAVDGASPAYLGASQMPRNSYPNQDGGSLEVSNRHPEQSTYTSNQMYPNLQQPHSNPPLQHQADSAFASNRMTNPPVSGSDLQHSLISQVKEKTQSGSWKRKHSIDGKKSNSEQHRTSKKARLSLEAQQKDKRASNDNNLDDPYAFDDDIEKSSVGSGSNSNSGVEFARFSANGRQGSTSSGPVYKFKSALLSREQSKCNTPEPAYQVPSPHGMSSHILHNEKKSDLVSNRSGSLSQNFVALNSISVPLRFDQSDNYFNMSCESFLSDLLSKPISVSRRPSIDNWRSAMAARAEKKADKRKAKELRKELAAEKAAALEKALVEKGSVVPAKVKGAAEQRELEKRFDSNSYSSHNSFEDNLGRVSGSNRNEDKKSQHVTFSPIPPVQYPPPPTPPNGDSGYSSNASSNANPGYAISNVSTLPPAMQSPAFQPQPQYYSSNSHTLMQNTSTSAASGLSSNSSSSVAGSHPSTSNLAKGNSFSPFPAPQRNAVKNNKFEEKQRQANSDNTAVNKSKPSLISSRKPDARMAKEDQKENRPKKSSSSKSPTKSESSRPKSEKNTMSPTKSSSTKSPSATEKRKAEERISKEKEDLKALQVNGNSNSLSSSNEWNNEKSKDSSNKPKVKKGALWAMPIVPKPPQKPNEKRKSQPSITTPVIPNSVPATSKKSDSSSSGSKSKSDTKPVTANKASKNATIENNEAGNGALVDVWRQAFGAVKPKKPVDASPLNNKLLIKQEIDAETCKKITYLDIPPEVRRRPKPSFGGLIHFPPDWERAVKRHHEKCRLPKPLCKGKTYMLLK